jgi:hypothetical protein
MLELKAGKVNDNKLVNNIKLKLVDIYEQLNQSEKAVKYYADLIASDLNKDQKDILTAGLLNLYLKEGQLDAAISLISNQLLVKDLGAEGPIGKVILDFMRSDAPNANNFAEKLAAIDYEKSGKRPKWKELLSSLIIDEEESVKPNDQPAEPKES